MTARYEEPETVRGSRPVSPGAAPESGTEQGDSGKWHTEAVVAPGNGAEQGDAPPDYGDSEYAAERYVEPETDPSRPRPATGPTPAPPAGDPVPSAGGPAPEPQPGPQQHTTSPQPSPAQQAPSPGDVSAAAPHRFGGTPGPYPVAGDGAGAHSPEGRPHVPPVQPGMQQPQPSPTQQPYPFPAPPQTPGAAGPGEQPFGPDLSSAQLLRRAKRPPQSGWRRAVYVASGRTINLGESPADLHRRELTERINQPLHGCYRIAMLSLKGGVGKTTATATLGSMFSSLRGDRVVAVDANPDRGTLSQKIPLETTATVRHLLRDSQRIRKYSDIRSYTSQGPSRLEILASEQDPAVSEAFSEDDYRRTVTLLELFYNVVLTDCGTGLMHSAMKGVLDTADSLVIVSSSSIDGARSASATLDWLDAHGYGDLVSRSVAVINSVRPGSGTVDVDKLTAHFGSRCRAVSRIPFDPHLDEGAEVELDQLASPTRLALLELAAIVADDFPYAFGRRHRTGP